MSFNILESSSKQIKFIVEDVDVSVVNSLRRIILSEIPNAAFAFDPNEESNDIIIHSNTGALHNEFLAHRLSLIPLHFDAKEIENFDPSKYTFKLKVQNKTSSILLVTTADFEIFDENGKKYDEKFHRQIFPADPITKDHILITKLKPNLYDLSRGEEIDVECKASIGIGKDHARWCPVSKCTYFNSLDDALVNRTRATIAPADKNKFEHLDKYRLFKKNKYDEPCSFEFEIETECKMTPKFLVKKAFDILKEQIESFAKSFAQEMEVRNEMHHFTIHDTTHTMINVLQALIYNNNFRDSSKNVLEFIGYHQSHPLDKKMILKMKFVEGFNDIEGFVKSQCTKITYYLDELSAKWEQA